MNTQDYIASGIIERYLLGELSEQERVELEAMAKKHPEVKAEIELVEATMMNFAAKTPPAGLKQKIAAQLTFSETTVIPLEQKKNKFPTWLVAACFALLIGSSAYNIILMNQLNDTKEQLAVVKTENEKFAVDFEAQSKSYGEMAQEMAVLMHPENKKIMLKGMEISPSSMAAIYWNQNTNDVYINVNSLPVPSADKQYQLWAIVDGKPVDAGVFTMTSDSASIQKMKSISGAQAFAVTLEKKGGNPTPTMTAMYLMGNV
ncbi:MAG: anti-sigma factor [Bacteroidetes bacterium]|nr:anti-sigma factor [Bacteroidota bacterium]